MAWRVVAGSLVVGLMLLLTTTALQAADVASDEFLQLVIKLIGDKDPEFRAAGLDQVRTAARGPTFTKQFASQLPKLDAGAQVALISALAERGDVAARPAVLEQLASSQEASVRTAVIESLGRIGRPDDLPLLIKTLTAGTSAEQQAARRSLVVISGQTWNAALAAAMEMASPTVKEALIDVLAARRAGDQSAAFMSASVDENSKVRQAAMAALGQIGRPDQLPQMLLGALKAQPGIERESAAQNVALVCSRIENEDQRATALIEALEAINVSQRDQLLTVVGRVGGARLINFVAAIATGTDGARRKAGIDALSKWPDATVADKLLEIATRATDPAERNLAFRGYVKVSAARDSRSDKERLDRMKQAMKAAKTPEEVALVINRVRTAYDIDAIRFVLPYLDQPGFAQAACETIVEIAHHREVRDPNKAEADKALDKVIAASKDPVVIERANRYKRGETFDRRPTRARR